MCSVLTAARCVCDVVCRFIKQASKNEYARARRRRLLSGGSHVYTFIIDGKVLCDAY